ncbi:hypothetical protein NPIL_505681 [Nephila pilipes]|uniref:Uncharacterized protein n=1 Tax=Nephila pilipes TaxID=299642 RepID=A0A8X6QF88_NEPPI|nr:hypothetical protein NPIL_505681 [Nephila pilipes]
MVIEDLLERNLSRIEANEMKQFSTNLGSTYTFGLVARNNLQMESLDGRSTETEPKQKSELKQTNKHRKAQPRSANYTSKIHNIKEVKAIKELKNLF